MSACSCKKFVQQDPPVTQLVGSEVFKDDLTATAALSYIYTQCAAGGFAGGGGSSVTVLCGLSADELNLYSTTDNLVQFFNNSVFPTNTTAYSSLWSDPYSIIYKCNILIEGLEQSTGVSQAVKDQLIGEALFMRAFSHFYLAGMHGNVPYVTTSDYRVNTAIAQTPYYQVLNAIIEDLKSAKALLANDYNFIGKERVRPNKWAASALLARAYLYNEDWSNAEIQSTEVLNQTAQYSLTTLNKVFLKNSMEAIWQIKPLADINANTLEGSQFILVGKPTNYALSQDLVDGFEADDQRKSAWVGTFGNSSGTWNFPYKYKIRSGSTPLDEYSMVLRLAEQYLIRAEARARLGKLDEAITDIDAIRSRAGLKKIAEVNPGISKESLLLAIEQERRIELFSEWGHRWFDLKRTGRAGAVLSSKKTSWVSTAVLFPIPASELKINKSLNQNNGYQQ